MGIERRFAVSMGRQGGMEEVARCGYGLGRRFALGVLGRLANFFSERGFAPGPHSRDVSLENPFSR